MENNQDFIRVDEWVCPEDKKYVYDNGKLLIVPFEVIYNKPNLQPFSIFQIKKTSYVNNLPITVNYINYFLNFYDKDKELLSFYLRMKFIIDSRAIDKLSEKAFIKTMYRELLTDEMKEKISKMVEDNTYVSVEREDTKDYRVETRFTNNDSNALMKISISIKLMIPVLFHYINVHRTLKKIELFRYYERLFEIFPSPDGDLYEKLWLSIAMRVNINYTQNNLLWQQKEIFGNNKISYLSSLLKETIISESIFKYNFVYSIVSFNTTILKNQMMYEHQDKYKRTPIEITNEVDSEGLSGMDKLEMSTAKVDESHIILSKVNIKNIIKRIEKSMNVLGVSDDEIDFYRQNHSPSYFHVQLVFYHYAKYFGGYRDLNLLIRKQYYKLMILLKKKLTMKKYYFLPLLLSGNVINKVNTRRIQNSKFLAKVETSSVFETIQNDKYQLVEELGKPGILAILSTLINTKFSYVEYGKPELLGEQIDLSKHLDMISAEILNFLNDI